MGSIADKTGQKKEILSVNKHYRNDPKGTKEKRGLLERKEQ
jgi:hypothetical protein